MKNISLFLLSRKLRVQKIILPIQTPSICKNWDVNSCLSSWKTLTLIFYYLPAFLGFMEARNRFTQVISKTRVSKNANKHQ